MRISILKPAAFVAVVVSCLGFSSSSVLSDDLKVALAAEPTSMDCLLYTSPSPRDY